MGAFRIEKGSSLVVQWLRLNASNAGGWGAQIQYLVEGSHMPHSQNKEKKIS